MNSKTKATADVKSICSDINWKLPGRPAPEIDWYQSEQRCPPIKLREDKDATPCV
jgi:hypothetical protein